MLFLLDEVARLGPMAALEAARDAGRKYGITLLLLYQFAGQLARRQLRIAVDQAIRDLAVMIDDRLFSDPVEGRHSKSLAI
jgi:hypothetical protein